MNTLQRRVSLSLLVLLVLAMTSVAAFAQKATVTGKITDKKSKEALSAKINVPSARTGANAKADGTYTLSLPAGTHQLIINFPLYKTIKKSITVAAGDNQTLDFSMDEDLVGLNEIVVLGTRRSDRTKIESPVPVDIVPAAEMRQNGMTETNQMIQMIVPSFNFPRPAIADGTDALRPATMRGLGPDQTLVLVNGKRRHTGALVHVNGTVGRGSTGVDLNAIPANMIDRIEVLRDGAAAQYGSDAIAGVINVILRKDLGLSVNATGGLTTRGDGQVVDVGANYGIGLPNGGFLHFGGTYRFRDSTNRTSIDIRRMAPGAGAAGDVNTGDWAFNDPRRLNHWQGDSRTRDLGGFLNGTLPISENLTAYIFGGYTYRESESYGFFRIPRDDRNDVSIYPNGFLPQIFARISDVSAGGGLKGEVAGFNYDLSAVYGNNWFNFNVRNSWNASLGPNSPRNFDCGALLYSQTSFNLDLSKSLEIGLSKPLNLAFGSEVRLENYQIRQGQPESWWNQPNNVGAMGMFPVRIPASQAVAATNPQRIPSPGAQVFPGFRPENETNQSRNNISLYLDAETDVVQNWNIGIAGRFETYSDFGSLFTWKAATRYEFVQGLAIRGAISTGFRAPSLQQQYFTSVATNFINGVPFDIGTLPPTSAAGRAFGAQPLKPETSVNISGGLTFDMIDNLSISVDYYNIAIKDRIILSGNFTGGAKSDSVPRLLAQAGVVGIDGGRFFTNILDTRTQGVDVIIRYGLNFGEAGTLRLTAAFNYNENKIERLGDAPTPLKRLEGLPGGIPPTGNTNALFDRGEQIRFEKGQPITNLNLMANYNVGKFAAMVRTMRFGEVTAVNVIAQPALDQVTSGLFITDIDLSYEIIQGLRLAVGSNNVFDVMPQEWTRWSAGNIPASAVSAGVYQGTPFPQAMPPVPANTGVGLNGTVFRYVGTAPWGLGGRFVYARLTFTLQ
jgi:iron complex outermembrane receptor protein